MLSVHVRTAFFAAVIGAWCHLNSGVPKPPWPVEGDFECLLGIFVAPASALARMGGGGLQARHDSFKPPVWSRRFVAKFV